MKLQVNTTAPQFVRNDVFGKEINLENYKGKKVLIAFFRHAGCPFCNLRVHKLMKKYEEWKAEGLEMIFFFESPERVIKYSSFHQGVNPVPIISDPEKEIYELFGLESQKFGGISVMASFIKTSVESAFSKLPNHAPKADEDMNTLPAEFLIDENQIVRTLHYSVDPSDRLEIDHIESFIQENVHA